MKKMFFTFLLLTQYLNKMIGDAVSANWDGTSEDGLQLKTGMYIVWVEIFSENGNIEPFKKVVLLSR